MQRVVVNGEKSNEILTISGVPQGSVLGPLLFLIYINSATSLPFSPGTHMTLYADDILLYKAIRKNHLKKTAVRPRYPLLLGCYQWSTFQSNEVQVHGCNTEEELSEPTNSDPWLPCHFSCLPVYLPRCHYIS